MTRHTDQGFPIDSERARILKTLKYVSAVLALLWLASLLMPVARTDAHGGELIPGFFVLLIGWLGPMMYQFGWLSNPLLLIALSSVLSRSVRPRTLRILAVALFLCTFDALFWREIPNDNSSNHILAFHAGYYVWLIAAFGAGVVALVKAELQDSIS